MAEITTWAQCLDATNSNNVATISCVFVVYRYVLDAVFLFAGAVAIVLIIIGGYKFINSGGDPKQVDSARKTLTYAIIGLLLIIFSFAIINFISTVTGVTCIKIFSFTNCSNEVTSTGATDSEQPVCPDSAGPIPTSTIYSNGYVCTCADGSTFTHLEACQVTEDDSTVRPWSSQ